MLPIPRTPIKRWRPHNVCEPSAGAQVNGRLRCACTLYSLLLLRPHGVLLLPDFFGPGTRLLPDGRRREFRRGCYESLLKFFQVSSHK